MVWNQRLHAALGGGEQVLCLFLVSFPSFCPNRTLAKPSSMPETLPSPPSPPPSDPQRHTAHVTFPWGLALCPPGWPISRNLWDAQGQPLAPFRWHIGKLKGRIVKLLSNVSEIRLRSHEGLIGTYHNHNLIHSFLGWPWAWYSVSPPPRLPRARFPRLCPCQVYKEWDLFASVSSHKCYISCGTWELPIVPWGTPRCLSDYKRKLKQAMVK